MSPRHTVLHVRTRNGEKAFEFGDTRFKSLSSREILPDGERFMCISVTVYRKKNRLWRLSAVRYHGTAGRYSGWCEGFMGALGEKAELTPDLFKHNDRLSINISPADFRLETA